MTMIRKSKAVSLRIDPEAHDLIARAAELRSKSVTAFMTEAAVATAQEELLDQRFIGVNVDVFQSINEQLSAPGKADERLVRLFRSDIEWGD